MSNTKNDAIELFKQAKTVYARMPLFGDKTHLMQMEDTLLEQLKTAHDALDDFRKGSILRVALDNKLPGWRYIDASDYLPKDKWRTFISNSPSEWFTWLTEQGIAEDLAQGLVDDAFGTAEEL